MVDFQYDALGRMRVMTDTLGTTEFDDDALSRLIEVIDPFGQEVSYQYDPAGNMTDLTFDGKHVSYEYDPLRRLEKVTDWSAASQVTTYGYDSSNRLENITLPNGVETSLTYDVASQLRKIEHLQGENPLARFGYDYDEVGNRTLAVEFDQNLTTTIGYEYDPLYRLTEANYDDGNYYHYGYDAVGNRVALTTTGYVTTSVALDVANQLIDVNGVQYDYDENARCGWGGLCWLPSMCEWGM